MSEDFRKKIRDYLEGKLAPEEKLQMEKEIEKLENYQAVLEEYLVEERSPEKAQKKLHKEELAPQKAMKIVSRAKWKARIQNAVTALVIILLGIFACGVVTAIYYSSGDPNRVSRYRDVVESTVALTEPNLRIRGSGSSVGPFFNMAYTGNLQKTIGGENVDAGDIKLSFLFSQVSYPERHLSTDSQRYWPFRYPTASHVMAAGWGTLEKLPEGTVAEVFLSFDDFYTTDQVLKKFKGREMRPLWFVVDTGLDDVGKVERPSFIGFPYEPVWHPEDMTVTSESETNERLFTKFETKSEVAPALEDYGSADLREKNFLDTLKLLRENDKIANRVAFGGELRINERLNYLDQHGIKIYGIVVTGPTKEILKMRKEAWVAGIHVGEVRLWNWEE